MAFYTVPSVSVGGAFGRAFNVIAPNAYDPARALGVIFLLHNYGDSGTGMRSRLDLASAQTTNDGYIVVAPTGTLDGANAHWNYWTTGGSSDFAFLGSLVSNLQSNGWNIDLSRVFVFGYSNGGLMAAQLVQQFPTMFTFMLTMAGSDGVNDSTAVTTEIPSITFHGDSDTTVLTAGEDPAVTLPGSLSSHGGVGSVGIKSAANTAAARHTRNGGVGALGANYGSIDFVTAVGGAETTRQKYADSRTEFWSGVGVNHAVSLSPGRGVTVLQHAEDNHR